MSGDSPTVDEVFERARPEEGTAVVPVRFDKDPHGNSRYMMVIQGPSPMPDLILAKLMALVEELHDITEQHAAMHDDNVAAPTQDKEKSEDGPRLIVP